MNIYKVTLEYRLQRVVEIVTDEDLSDSEVAERAKAADTEINGYLTAPVLYMRRTLKAALCEMIGIEHIIDVFNIDSARAVIDKLTHNKCFSPSGRLGIYPIWLTKDLLEKLVGFGLLRRDIGTGDTLKDTQYYLTGDSNA